MATADTSFAIEEPAGSPSPRVRNEQIERNIDEARRHPGQWCRVWAYTTQSTAATMATSLSKRFPDAIWRSSKRDDGTYGVYGKFI